jgi:hypothetical protein
MSGERSDADVDVLAGLAVRRGLGGLRALLALAAPLVGLLGADALY